MPIGSVIIDPPAPAWHTALARRNTTETARRFRQQLGLPDDRPAILSGHQAAIWHAGILAKYLAAGHLAAAHNAAAGWVIVDQDPEDFATIRVPMRARAGSPGGRLTLRTAELVDPASAALVRSGTPPCQIPRFTVAKSPDIDALLEPADHASPSTHAGFCVVLATLAGAPGRNAAEQLSAATALLTAPLAPPLRHIHATALAHTDAFAALVARMAADAARCRQTYNDAAARFPAAHIAPLGANAAGSPELPLWLIDPRTGLRKRVFASDLADLRPAQLAPRALTLTALLRLYGCDLFIHGAGGGATDSPAGYDRVTETWLAAWLGSEATLAPAVVASATVTLNFDTAITGEVTAADVEAARQRARKARHDPSLVGDTRTPARKQELVAALEKTKDKLERARLFDEMKHLLADAEKANAPALARLDAEAEALAARLADHPIATDRTYAFPLHDAKDLQALSTTIRDQLQPSK